MSNAGWLAASASAPAPAPVVLLHIDARTHRERLRVVCVVDEDAIDALHRAVEAPARQLEASFRQEAVLPLRDRIGLECIEFGQHARRARELLS